jgi:hypothetical protein
MCEVPDKAPPGWLTIDQWAERMGYSHSRTATILRTARLSGSATRKTFRVEREKFAKTTREFWWVRGASEKIAGMPVSKRGGVSRQP